MARGESACTLAGRVGVDVDAFRTANAFAEAAEQPLAGGPVTIPAHAALRHQVRAGETLHELARWYGHPVDVLAARNRIDDPNRIVAGAWLSIPAGARTGCPPAAPTLAKPAAPEPEARVVATVSPEPAVPKEALARADVALEEAGRRYRAADFEAVLELTEEAQHVLPAGVEDPASIDRRARASWLAGLANAGLDRREAAIASLREALELRPSLRDEQSVSPRILELLDAPAGGGP